MNILLTTDSSADSWAAVDLLEQFRWAPEDTLHILCVVETYVLLTGRIDDPSDGVRQQLMDAETSAAMNLVERTAAALRPHCPHVETRVHLGFPVREILAAAGEIKADLVVVGSRGKSALQEFFLGSVSRSILDTAVCSVLVARPEVQKLRRVVLGYDGSPQSETALEWLRRLPFPKGVEVKVVHVAEPERQSDDLSQGPALPERSSAVEALQSPGACRDSEGAYGTGLTLQDLRLTIEERACGEDPLTGILEAIREHHADLVIVGAHSRQGWLQDLIGNTTMGILRRSPCSILIVREGVAYPVPWWMEGMVPSEDPARDLSEPVSS
jgi:nucleotide-binding universal stress UspA family protein